MVVMLTIRFFFSIWHLDWELKNRSSEDFLKFDSFSKTWRVSREQLRMNICKIMQKAYLCHWDKTNTTTGIPVTFLKFAWYRTGNLTITMFSLHIKSNFAFNFKNNSFTFHDFKCMSFYLKNVPMIATFSIA